MKKPLFFFTFRGLGIMEIFPTNFSEIEDELQLIKNRMIERAPNATRLMDKLCEKGLIERIRCKEDRRVVYVVITKAGLSLLTKIDTHGNISFLDKLSEEEAAVLSDLLDKIR